MNDAPATVDYEAREDDPQYSAVRFYRLLDPIKDREFEGVLLAAVSTEDPELPRWTTLDLYRTTEGRYVYYRVGHSLVYHVPGTSMCRSGVPTEAADLPEDAEPCERCHPPLEPESAVNMEQDLRAVFVCDDVDGVLQSLVKTRNGASTLSRPAQRLLADAARRDPAFLEYRRTERL